MAPSGTTVLGAGVASTSPPSPTMVVPPTTSVAMFTLPVRPLLSQPCDCDCALTPDAKTWSVGSVADPELSAASDAMVTHALPPATVLPPKPAGAPGQCAVTPCMLAPAVDCSTLTAFTSGSRQLGPAPLSQFTSDAAELCVAFGGT